MKLVPLAIESVGWEPDPMGEDRCYFTVHCLNGDGGRVFAMPCDLANEEVGADPAATQEQIAVVWLQQQWDRLPVVGLDAGLRNLVVPEIPPHVTHSG